MARGLRHENTELKEGKLRLENYMLPGNNNII
jgi:hypothetical protein